MKLKSRKGGVFILSRRRKKHLYVFYFCFFFHFWFENQLLFDYFSHLKFYNRCSFIFFFFLFASKTEGLFDRKNLNELYFLFLKLVNVYNKVFLVFCPIFRSDDEIKFYVLLKFEKVMGFFTHFNII